MKKRRKKSDKTKMIEKLDKLWSLAVRTRDRFQCRKEGCPANGRRNSQGGHIWGRSHKAVRWDPDNGITMCYYHHIHWSHREPVEFTEWVVKQIGKDKFEALKKKAYNRNYVEPTMEQMLEIEQILLKKIAYFENRNEEAAF